MKITFKNLQSACKERVNGEKHTYCNHGWKSSNLIQCSPSNCAYVTREKRDTRVRLDTLSIRTFFEYRKNIFQVSAHQPRAYYTMTIRVKSIKTRKYIDMPLSRLVKRISEQDAKAQMGKNKLTSTSKR